MSNNDAKPTLFVGLSSALPTNGPEPNQLTLLLVDDDATDGTGRADGAGAGAGLILGLEAPPGPGAVSLHCCQSQANPSKTGLRGAGGGGGGVVVRLVFGVTTTWLSKAYEVTVNSTVPNELYILK